MRWAALIQRIYEVDPLKCPKCGGTTDAINYGGDTGILIDRCTACQGVWLDELPAHVPLHWLTRCAPSGLVAKILWAVRIVPRMRQPAAEARTAPVVIDVSFSLFEGIHEMPFE